MILFSRAQVHPIGLDIGHDSVKMLQLEQVGETLSVLSAAKASLPPEVGIQPHLRTAAAVEVIRKLLRRNPFRGKLVVAALPGDVVHTRIVRLPQTSTAEMAQAVGSEARHTLPFDPHEARVAHLPAGEVRQGTDVRQEVIVLAARNADVSHFLETISRTGVTAHSLDVEACALYRTVDRFVCRHEDEQDVFVLVDVGTHRSQVVIGRGRQIRFIKTIEIGGRHFHDAVSRKLGISAEEAQALRRRLAEPVEGMPEATTRDPVRQAACDASRTLMEELGREIALCLRYYSVTFRGHQPTCVRVLGGEAADPHLHALLSRSLPIPVEVGRPLCNVDTSRMSPADRRGPMTDWAVAFGLALKTVVGTVRSRDRKPCYPSPPVTGGAVRIPLVDTDGPLIATANEIEKQ